MSSDFILMGRIISTFAKTFSFLEKGSVYNPIFDIVKIGRRFSATFFMNFFLYSFLFSAPSYNIPIKLQQPSGNIINCFISGDEFYHWLHDKNNYTVVKNKITGFYEYALLLGDSLAPSGYIVGITDPSTTNLVKGINIPNNKVNEIRKKLFSQSNSELKKSSFTPVKGKITNVVVFVRFKGESEFVDNISKYETLFNSQTESSLKNYFDEVSYGQITITSYFLASSGEKIVSYEDTYERKYYQPYDATSNTIGYKTEDERKIREQNLVRYAVVGLRDKFPTDINLDNNNDGVIDHVSFIIKGSVDEWSDLLWPHSWSHYLNSVFIRDKQLKDYNFHIEKSANRQILCHEMFHSLGAPDLYHYSNSIPTPVGPWDVMHSGNGHMLMHMKVKYGFWVDVIPTIVSNGKYTLNPTTSKTNNCYKIQSFKNDYEYFILEYRKKSGLYENNLPGSGLIIYRMNSKYNGNADGPPDEIYIYRPNGTLTEQGKIDSSFFDRKNGRDIFNDTTNPSCFLSNGGLGNIEIKDVITDSGKVSFTINIVKVLNNTYTVQKTNYNWIDISKTGTEIKNWKNGNLNDADAKNDGFSQIPIGFNFSFFENKYNSLYVGINGLVSFTSKPLNSAIKFLDFGIDSNGIFEPSFAWPWNKLLSNSIAVAYHDFDLNIKDGFGNGKILYQTINNKFILSWENVGIYGYAGKNANLFQLILDKSNSSITMQYNKFEQTETRNIIKIGIQEQYSRGYDWISNGNPEENLMQDKSALVFIPHFPTKVSNNVDYANDYILDQNYPNPFNPKSNILYSIPERSKVILRIYNVLGKEVKTLVNEMQEKGKHTISFELENTSSGVYFYHIQVFSENGLNVFNQTKKLVLIK